MQLAPFRSIRNTLIVLFIVVSTATLGAFAVHRHLLLRSDLDTRFEQNREEILRNLGHDLAEPVWALNAELMRTRLEATLVYPEVVGACILAPDGKEPYATARREPAGQATQTRTTASGLPCTATDPHDVVSEIAIYPPDNIDAERRRMVIGNAIVVLSRTAMRKTLRTEMVRDAVEVAVVDVLLVVLLTLSLRMVFGPLEQLQRALFKLASSEGDQLEELPKFDCTEFDNVIIGFNRVLRRLKLIIAQRTEAEMAAHTATRTAKAAFAQIQATQAELMKKNRQLEALSITDQLTGVFNRRRLDEVLHDTLERCQRQACALSIILIDADRFKSINDTHGHQVGDLVLVELGCRILEVKRPTDTAGRWGGEEFLLICPDTTPHDAVLLAEQLCSAIAERGFPAVGRLTASLGVASAHRYDTIHGMIARADAALYQSKKSGRNRVTFVDAAGADESDR